MLVLEKFTDFISYGKFVAMTTNYLDDLYENSLAQSKSVYETDRNHAKLFDAIKILKPHQTFSIGKSKTYLKSTKAHERYFAILLLGQICNPVEAGEEKQAEEIIKWLSDMLREEKDSKCLAAIADTLGYPYSHKAAPPLLLLSKNSDRNVRLAATISLGSVTIDNESDEIIDRLVALSSDEHPDIRDWATMHIASLKSNSQKVVNALLESLKDRNFDTKSEAIYGLAMRDNKIALPVLKRRLGGVWCNKKDIESAGIYASPKLLPELNTRDKSPNKYLLEWAKKRCSSDLSVRDSVDDKWLGDDGYLMVRDDKRPAIKFRNNT